MYRGIHFVVSKVNVNKTHIKYFFHDILLLSLTLWVKHSFVVIYDHFFAHIGRYLSQSHLRTKERNKQGLFRNVMVSLQLVEGPQNPKYDNFIY